jgi:dihydrofolate reductase
VNDVISAMTQAKEAAGDKNVLVHGAGTAQLALTAGVLDEIELHVIPCSSAKGAVCFRDLRPSRWSRSAPGSSRARAVSPTCTTE